MKCSCPKCSALLPEDLSGIPEKGKSEKCSECGASYWIHRESFMLRCYAVAGERYCCNCGEALGVSTYCPGCGTLYPDYCVVESKKPAARAFEKKTASFNFSLPSFSKKSAASVGSQRLMSPGKSSGPSNLRRQLIMVGVGVAFLAVIAGVVIFYLRDRAENKFTADYVVALYGIRSGTDQCLKKSAILSGGNKLVDKDLVQLKSVKGEISTALQALDPPPGKFADAYDRLLALSATYDKLYNICSTAAPSAEVASSTGALDGQFIQQAKELKTTLPPQLLAELKSRSLRYKNLQFILE